MKEELQQKIRQAIDQLESAAEPHDLPTSAQAWSRVQFRLAYRPRTNRYASQTGSLLAAVYILSFLVWTTWSGLLSASFLALLTSAAAAAVFLFLQASRSFRS